MRRDKAQRIIEAIKSQRKTATDKNASQAVEIYPTLKQDGSLIKSGTRINWKGKLKKATSDLWDTEQNNPNKAPNLWEEINYQDGYRIIPNPITVSSAFSLGEFGWWENELYKSLAGNNVYTPEQYLPNWEKVKE